MFNISVIFEDRKKIKTDSYFSSSLFLSFKHLVKATGKKLVLHEIKPNNNIFLLLGTRCIQVEEAVRESGKKLVLVLNKADLVPRTNLTTWLKYLRRSAPAVPFKASTQDQQHNLGRRKMKHVVKEKEMKGQDIFDLVKYIE